MPSEGAVSVCPTVAVGQTGGLIHFARVLFGSQQTVVIGRIGRFDFEEPACAVRVAVGGFRRAWQVIVDGNDFARNRRIRRMRLYELNHTGLFFGGEVRTDFGQLDKHDVAQQLLRVMVIPTVMIPSSRRSHSWLATYFSSVGMLLLMV